VSKQISSALSEVMRSVGYVQKDRRAEFGDRYKYASEAAFIGAVREAMVKSDLVLRPMKLDARTEEHAPTRQGARQYRCDLVATYELSHTSGETLIVQSLGCGIDVGDKAAYKAMTGAYKYAIRQLLMLETGDDPDHQHSSQQESAALNKPTATAAKPPPPREKDATWEASRSGFCAELGRLGVEYEKLAEYLESIGRERPSAMDAATRASLIRALKPETAFRAKFDAHLTTGAA